ncbi:MAG: PQQ-binding-like beta-propeller repeat protein [Pirellulaceae bacterium]
MTLCWRILAVAMLLAAVAAPARAADWPQFLGPQRSGISAETGLVDAFPSDGPKELWRAKGGVGMSGLAIAGGKLLTLVQRDGQQWAIALDAQTGKPLWQTPLAAEYKNQMGDGPRATPTIAGERVFALTGEGILAAVNLHDGKLQWSQKCLEQLKAKPADYGMACSPLVVDGQVIVTLGAPAAAVAAFDAKTGKQVWTAASDPAGYSSPALLSVAGQPQIVAFTGGSVVGLAPRTGKLLWRHPYVTDYDCNIATPVGVEGKVFVSAGENHGSALLEIKPQGETFDVSEVWSSEGNKSTLRNEWQTSILLDGHLYGFDNVGSAGPVTHLTCIKAATGERVWQEPRFGKGNLIAADGKLWISTMEGELVVVRASPKGFEELARAAVLGSTRQAPALAGGLLYLRDDKEIICLDVRKP